MWSGMGALWVAGGCGVHWDSTCQCVSWVFAVVHWGMSMYTGSHCVALDHNLVCLWFLSSHCDFLLCIEGYAGGGGGGRVGGL